MRKTVIYSARIPKGLYKSLLPQSLRIRKVCGKCAEFRINYSATFIRGRNCAKHSKDQGNSSETQVNSV